MGQVIKAAVPKGTRDFSPSVMMKRNYLFDVVRRTFERFGFEPIETPGMENLSTLTGKYGEEGDRLIFKIINSGDFLEKSDKKAFDQNDSSRFARSVAKKALRYDLTVPFARYVAQHRNDITFPFRRYQMQPVWRADRPQKGRYQEFYQCDADVIGSTSLVNEAELIQIFGTVFGELGLPVVIRFNNRKILKGIAELIGAADRFAELSVILDKLDKIGAEGVTTELEKAGMVDGAMEKLDALFNLQGNTSDKLMFMQGYLMNSETGMAGLKETQEVWGHLASAGFDLDLLNFDPLLARGLDYYTGAIFEVVAKGVQIGSICGGGRYDDLTGIFGLDDVSGVGISFGIDRIYDAMDELALFNKQQKQGTQLLFVNFGESEVHYVLKHASRLREAGVNVEIYPDPVKMKKQMKYADVKGIRYVAIAGTEEMKAGALTLKDMQVGTQELMNFDELLKKLTSHG